MKRLLIAGLALFVVASVATAQVTPGTPLGTTPGVTGTVGGTTTAPGVAGTVGGTAGVQAPGLYPGGMTAPYGMTSGYNQYGGMNYTTSPYGSPYTGGYQGGVMQSGYTPAVGGYGVGYPGSGCGCGSAAYSQPVVYSQPVSSGCCGKKKKGLFGGGLFR